MINRLVMVPLVLALTAAGCGAAAAGDESSAPGAPRFSHPTGPRDVVLRVSTGGGFVPSEVTLATVPEFTLYGDGNVIVPGAVMAIYPGPAMLPLQSFRLSERRVQALLGAASRAGLLDERPVDYGDMGSVGITDMPTTTVTFNVDGKQVRHDAYGLSADVTGGRLSPRQREARRALSRFVGALPHGSSASQYTPSAIAVHVGPFRGERLPGAVPIVWPLDSNLAREGKRVSDGLPYRCFTVTGDDTATLLAALRNANDQTQWLARPGRHRTFGLVLRPLLPDEHGCN
jgi:hypothetical protein